MLEALAVTESIRGRLHMRKLTIALAIITSLTGCSEAPTNSPSAENAQGTYVSRALPAAGDPAPSFSSKFARLRLSHGVQIDVPRDWWVLDAETTSLIKTSTEAALDITKNSIPNDKEIDLIRANSLPRSTYASLAITSTPSDPSVIAEIENLSSADLVEFDSQMQDKMLPQMMSVVGQNLMSYYGSHIEKIDSKPALVVEYLRSGPEGPVVVQTNRIFTGTQEITLNLAYRESEKMLWRPVLARIRQSFSVVK